ncbi:MAG: thioredoxin family protein [Thermogutta sp.]
MKATLILLLAIFGTHAASDRSDAGPAAEQFAYSLAYQRSIASQQPLVVIVGAQWCPACRKLEKEVIPKIEEVGLLKKAVLAVVDYDAESKLAKQLTRGGPIPQVIVFWQADNGWKSDRLIGYPSDKAVLSFLETITSAKAKPASGSQAQN